MNRLVIILIMCLPYFASAQPGVATVVEKNGKKYYEHNVESGNTLWGLQGMYGVSVEQIVAENPSLSSGLKEGQKVYIPVTQASIKKIPTTDYKVDKGETLYGLARKFNTTVDDLVALNPELKDNGLSKGQVIKVPVQENSGQPVVVKDPVKEPISTTPNPFVADTVTMKDGTKEQVSFKFSDSTIRHIVMSHETLYSVSKRFMVSVDEIMRINGLKTTAIKEGQILIIPVQQERIERVEIKKVPDSREDKETGPLVFEKKKKYKIAILLPFYLDGGDAYSSRVSQLATQFYMGAKLALDSLERRGLVADLIIFDTKNDSTYIGKILADTSFRSMDLVIGPFYESHMAALSAYCKENRIRLVCPVATSEEYLIDNRLVYESVPSGEVTMELLAKHLLKNNSRDHIVLVKPTLESDMAMYTAFKEAFESAPHNGGQRPILTETTMDAFTSQMRSGVVCHIIMPSKDKKTAMKFMNALGKKGSRSTNVFVYGTKEWEGYSEVNNVAKNKYNFRFASSNFLDYYSDIAISVNRRHRAVFKTDLSRMAAHGYDVVSYFCSDFFLTSKKPALVMNGFTMEQVSPTSGYRNNQIFVIQQEDFELFDINLKHD